MSHVLVPRLTAGAALIRLAEIEAALRRGEPASALVIERLGPAIPNATGGRAANEGDLRMWRSGVIDALDGLVPGSSSDNARHSMRLGEAISVVVNPSPSDASHDGTWSFLGLMLFPDLLALRWPSTDPSGGVAKDRWIGSQAGRDRNYLKLAWRRWQILGAVMTELQDPFGEDIFGALLERSAVARNPRLIRAAARQTSSYRGSLGRMEFTRALMQGITAMTGPLQVDILSDEEIERLVHGVAVGVDPRVAEEGA